MLTLCLLLLTSAAPEKCALPILMARTEAQPRTPAFKSAAERFDHATASWKKRRFLEAAREFLDASALFAADGFDGNWKYALQNAVMAFEASGKLVEAGTALEAAARNDPAHAEAIRAAAAALVSRMGCQ